MRKRILRDMRLITLSAMLLFAALLLIILHDNLSQRLLVEMEYELTVLATAMDRTQAREPLLEAVAASRPDARYTWIAADGAVLFDSAADGDALENHAAREEVKEALASGCGQSRRHSGTLNRTAYYCALRLEDGSVIRLAGAQQNPISLLSGILPLILLILAAVFLASGFLSARMTRAIIAPINALDPDAPASAEIYDELKPLLERLTQHRNE